VRVELMMGPVEVSAQSARPHELVWLVGRDGTPDILLARTGQGSARVVGAEFGALLGPPVEEKNAPNIIEL
jgi:hypothetical protein